MDLYSGVPKELRRNPIDKMNRRAKINWAIRVIGVLALIALLIVLFIQTFVPKMEAHARDTSFKGKVEISYQGKTFEPGTLCGQAVLDHESWGRDFSPELKKYCHL